MKILFFIPVDIKSPEHATKLSLRIFLSGLAVFVLSFFLPGWISLLAALIGVVLISDAIYISGWAEGYRTAGVDESVSRSLRDALLKTIDSPENKKSFVMHDAPVSDSPKGVSPGTGVPVADMHCPEGKAHKAHTWDLESELEGRKESFTYFCLGYEIVKESK